MKVCGAPPRVIGHIELSPVEMMAWLYCPIKLVGRMQAHVPANLRQFWPIITAVRDDIDANRWRRSYVYITAKTLWVTPEAPGNRPGWHADGYGSTDLNYVWSDCNPTLFWEPSCPMEYPEDHKDSMVLMTIDAESMPQYVRTYHDKTLLCMDETVIHNVAPCPKPGFRTFVKVSVSDHRYLLAGNSINHELAPDWRYEPRGIERNDPIAPIMKAGDGHYDQSETVVG